MATKARKKKAGTRNAEGTLTTIKACNNGSVDTAINRVVSWIIS